MKIISQYISIYLFLFSVVSKKINVQQNISTHEFKNIVFNNVMTAVFRSAECDGCESRNCSVICNSVVEMLTASA